LRLLRVSLSNPRSSVCPGHLQRPPLAIFPKQDQHAIYGAGPPTGAEVDAQMSPKSTQARTSPRFPCPPRRGVHRHSPVVTWPLIGPRPRKPPHPPRVYDMRCCSFQTHVMVQRQNCGEAKPATNVLMGGCGGRFHTSAGNSPPPFFFAASKISPSSVVCIQHEWASATLPHFWLANQLSCFLAM
jgi:hypothetical protein